MLTEQERLKFAKSVERKDMPWPSEIISRGTTWKEYLYPAMSVEENSGREAI